MSTNAPARPVSSRRTFLTAGAAALAGASTVATVTAVAATQDPALIAAAAERQAWERYSDLVYVEGEAEEALWASEWDRKPRVLVAEYTSIVRGPDLEQIPFDEWVAKPIYVHTHADRPGLRQPRTSPRQHPGRCRGAPREIAQRARSRRCGHCCGA